MGTYKVFMALLLTRANLAFYLEYLFDRGVKDKFDLCDSLQDRYFRVAGNLDLGM